MKKLIYVFFLLITAQSAFAQNHAPQATTDLYTVLEEIPYPLTPLQNDSDPDGDPLTWEVIAGPNRGRLDTIFNNVFYTSDVDYFGPDLIFYRACDTATPRKCAFASIIINVLNINDPPAAANDTFNTNEDVAINMNVLANDRDPDHDPMHISAINQQPTYGTATIVNNRIEYVPDANYYGTDQLRYRVCDTSNIPFLQSCDNARVFIRIRAVNDAPTAYADSITDDPTDDTLVVTNVLINDTDFVEGDPLHLTAIIPGNGISADAVFNFDSAGNITVVSSPCGTDTFYYLACDSSLCDTGTVYLTIICPKTANVFLPQGFSPDGDGINDKLVFPDISNYLPANIKVFNRYGSIVYESNDYQNDWDGTGIDTHQPIPDGTYYYVLRLANGQKMANYLVVNR